MLEFIDDKWLSQRLCIFRMPTRLRASCSHCRTYLYLRDAASVCFRLQSGQQHFKLALRKVQALRASVTRVMSDEHFPHQQVLSFTVSQREWSAWKADRKTVCLVSSSSRFLSQGSGPLAHQAVPAVPGPNHVEWVKVLGFAGFCCQGWEGSWGEPVCSAGKAAPWLTASWQPQQTSTWKHMKTSSVSWERPLAP